MKIERTFYDWHSQGLKIKQMEKDISPTIPAAMGLGGGKHDMSNFNS